MGKRLEAKTPFIPESVFTLPPAGKKKFQPQSTRRPQRVFSQRTKKKEKILEYFTLSALCYSFLLRGNQTPSISGSSMNEKKRMTEEEAEGAEIIR